jgi:hypothetical protein
MEYNILVNTKYNWKGFGNGFGNWDSYCQLKLVEFESETIVIMTDSNTGTSITNSVEFITPLIIHDFNLNPLNTKWIHHYPYLPGERDYPHSFDIIEYDKITIKNKQPQLNQVVWKPLIFNKNGKIETNPKYFRYELAPNAPVYLGNICAEIFNLELINT